MNFAAPTRLIPQSEALALIPPTVAATHNLLPLRLSENALYCAGPGPFDLDVLSRIQFQLQRQLILVKVPHELFNQAFESQYGSRLFPQTAEYLSQIASKKPKLKSQNPNNPMEWARQPLRLTSIIGAQGGAGTTTIATNLATILAEQNLNVAYLDANFSRPTAHIALGCQPQSTIRDLSRGTVNPWDALQTAPGGVRLLAGEPGATDYALLRYQDLEKLGASPNHLAAHFDHYIVDLPGSLAEPQMTWLLRSNAILIVTTLDPASLHNALAITESIYSRVQGAPINILFNQSADRDAKAAFLKLRTHCSSDSLRYAGALPTSKIARESWQCQTPLALWKPRDPLTQSIKTIQQALLPSNWNQPATATTHPAHQPQFERG
jgi:flagellar biosynthesis protein FlhG